MSSGMYGVVSFGAAVIFVAALIGWHRRDRRRVDAQFRMLAKETALRLTIPKPTALGLFCGLPRLDGSVEGFDASVECHVAGHEELNRRELLVRIAVPSPREFGMIICRKRQLGVRRLTKGLQPWTSNDPSLDEKFSFWTNDGEGMVALLGEELRSVLRDGWPKARVYAALNQGALTFYFHGLPRTDEMRGAARWCLEIGVRMAKHFEKK